MSHVTQAQLREHFEYKAGNLIRTTGPRKGREFGTARPTDGRVRGNFGGKMYYIHRLIWIFHNGAIPDGLQVDHINADCTDNRIENLRLATASQNSSNRPRASKSGYRGVSEHHTGIYQARIKHHGRTIYIGIYMTEEEAAHAYDIKAKELHGEFAILNFPEKVLD